MLSCALTAFDIKETNTWEELEANSVYVIFDKRGQSMRTRSEDTMSWWKQQTDLAWNLTTIPNDEDYTYPLHCGLLKINSWIKRNKIDSLVGNGINFDNAILSNICDQTKEPYPLPYWSDLDLRTMKAFAKCEKLNFPKDKLQHYALHDSIYEAMCAQAYYNSIHSE